MSAEESESESWPSQQPGDTSQALSPGPCTVEAMTSAGLAPASFYGVVLEGEHGPIVVAADPQHSDLVHGRGRLMGFAALSPETRSAIAALGGRAAHAKGTAHRYTTEEGRAAGKKSGQGRRGRAVPKVKKVRVYLKGKEHPQHIQVPHDSMLIDALKAGA